MQQQLNDALAQIKANESEIECARGKMDTMTIQMRQDLDDEFLREKNKMNEEFEQQKHDLKDDLRTQEQYAIPNIL